MLQYKPPNPPGACPLQILSHDTCKIYSTCYDDLHLQITLKRHQDDHEEQQPEFQEQEASSFAPTARQRTGLSSSDEEDQDLQEG